MLTDSLKDSRDNEKDCRRFVGDGVLIENRGHVGEFWSDRSGSHGQCTCGGWQLAGEDDCETVIASWRTHVDEATGTAGG